MFIKGETIAGAAAGMFGTLLGFPLDTIKTRMQTSHTSMAFTCRTVFRENGIGGFYQGVGSPLMALTILNSLNFTLYSLFTKGLHAVDGDHVYLERVYLSGALVGPAAALISTPFEYVKIQSQLNRNLSRNSAIAAMRIVKFYGLKQIYTGHVINSTRESVFLSTYFTAYESFKRIGREIFHNDKVSVPMAGGFAGAFGWFVSFPLDSVKSKIQGQTLTLDRRPKTVSAIKVLRNVVCEKGIRSLYNGVAPSIMRAFIVSSSRFTAYEVTLRYVRKWKDEEDGKYY